MLRKIVVITGPYVIPSIYYGGIQRIVHLLCSGLSEQGIEVDLLAGTGSSTYSGRTYTYRHQKPTLQSRLYRRLAFQATAIRAALDRADLIHSFVMWPEYHGLLHALNLPILFTQQNTAAADDWERIVKVNQSRSFYIGISQDQISSVQGLPPERSTVIGNATDFNLIRPVADPSGAYLAFLGRLSHDKGVDLAIRLSLATGIPLKIAGIIPHEEKGADQFFHEHVAPYLSRSGIEYIGEIDDGAKSTFLGNALALLMPNRWREPFGIVMVEALAAGTPVIGSNLGSIPELVEHGQTGFICDSFEAFVEAIRRVHQLDRTICRTSGERRFSKSVFIQAHLDFYASALAMLSPPQRLVSLLKILFIADPHIPVPPLKYGGAERIVDIYATEFKRLGHQVDIMAGLGSRNNGGCLHVHQAPTMAYHSRAKRKLQFQLQSLWAARDADVVYNHGRFDYMQSLLCINKPSVHAFHNPIDQQQIDSAEALIRSRFAFQCLSENQRSQVRISHPVHIIPNPVNSSIYQLGSGEGGYLAFLGRLTANKGVDAAIDVAHRTGQRLVIAGNQSTEEGASKYFRQAISPHLDGDQIRWIGPVDDAQKHELLAGASALLFPIRWDEPFGMVMIEALACGTPVIATRMGSTPEVIDHGSTGFLCDTVEDMVQAIKDLSAISRSDCRTVAETRFDVRTIAPRILEILYQLASKEKF